MNLSTLSLIRIMQRCLLLSGAAIFFTFSASAQSSTSAVQTSVEWSNLCANTAREQLVVTTESGETVRGYCFSVQHDELALRTADGKMIKIARGALKKVLAQPVPEHRLKALGKNMHHSLHDGVRMTFSPEAPIGLVMIPGTLAWGAVAAPFCILGDVFADEPPQRLLNVHQ